LFGFIAIAFDAGFDNGAHRCILLGELRDYSLGQSDNVIEVDTLSIAIGTGPGTEDDGARQPLAHQLAYDGGVHSRVMAKHPASESTLAAVNNSTPDSMVFSPGF